MKFKSIILVFNVALVFFLAVIILLPNVALGSAFAASYWKGNYPIIAVMFLVLCAFNTFYFINRKLFTLLEKEDWPALSAYLEEKVLQKGKYTPRNVRLLASSYLILSDSAAVMNLENKLSVAKPGLIDSNAMLFGTARVLAKDIPGAIRFFEVRKDTVKPALRDWVRWYHGFALLLARRYEEAAEEFSFLARTSRDGVIIALSAFFLSENLAKAVGAKSREYRETASLGREKVLQAIPDIKAWERTSTRLSSEIHVAAITRQMEDAGKWLYSGR